MEESFIMDTIQQLLVKYYCSYFSPTVAHMLLWQDLKLQDQIGRFNVPKYIFISWPLSHNCSFWEQHFFFFFQL